MKIVFCSNFMNHHQENLSQEFYRLCDGEYYFLACEPIEQERLDMGYEDMNEKYDFIVRPYDNEQEKKRAKELIKNCDLLIFGSGDKKYLKMRMKLNLTTFEYTERIFKEKNNPLLFMRKVLGMYRYFGKYKKKSLYILCASAYTALDINRFFNFKNKCYKFGYFPKVQTYDIESILKNKKKNSLVWAGRMIDWKHPEIPVLIAKRLKEEGYSFALDMIGCGEMEKDLSNMIREHDLGDYVTLHGAVPHDKVRAYMENAEIFLFTSDFNEGWGAVLNEAMNSGCACVASHAIGSVPFMLRNKENGLIYKNGDLDDLYNKVKYLLNNPDISTKMGKEAYRTLEEDWNATVVAQRIVALYEQLSKGEKGDLFKSGPCSKAESLDNEWYIPGE